MSKNFVLALDVGMVTDHAALAVIEGDHTGNTFAAAVRFVHQFPIGTPYAELAAFTKHVLHEGVLGNIPVVLDITAVGPGLIPVVREAIRPAWLEPVVITAGGTAAEDENKTWRVPKRDLITTVQLLLQGERLKIPATLPNAQLLVDELKSFRSSLPLSANPDTLDWRERPHDHLVFATALACWWAQRYVPYEPGSIISGGNEELHAMLDLIFPPQDRIDFKSKTPWW
jgi:hypothetical protein